VKAKQLTFDNSKVFKDHKYRSEHGGGVREGMRKLSRPFDSKKFIHATLRSKRARGKWSFLREQNRKKIDRAIYSFAEKFNVKIIRFANSGNHLHILLKARTRDDLQRFFKVIGGLIPRFVTQARRGSPIGKFWDGLTYSKIVSWGRQFKNTASYVTRNTLEAFGVIPPRDQARGHVKVDYDALILELFDG
jgi:REP element-mobilizing transposase RayT